MTKSEELQYLEELVKDIESRLDGPYFICNEFHREDIREELANKLRVFGEEYIKGFDCISAFHYKDHDGKDVDCETAAYNEAKIAHIKAYIEHLKK